MNLRGRHRMTLFYLMAEWMIDGAIFDLTMPMDTLRQCMSIARALLAAAAAKTNICVEGDSETIKGIFMTVLDWTLPRIPGLRAELEQLKKDLGV